MDAPRPVDFETKYWIPNIRNQTHWVGLVGSVGVLASSFFLGRSYFRGALFNRTALPLKALKLTAFLLSSCLVVSRKRIVFNLGVLKNHMWPSNPPWSNVHGRVYLASVPTKEGRVGGETFSERFDRANVTVIDLREASEEPIGWGSVKYQSATYEGFSGIPDFEPVPLPALVQLVERIEEASGTVVIHCKSGTGRSVTVVAAYLMKKQMTPVSQFEIGYYDQGEFEKDPVGFVLAEVGKKRKIHLSPRQRQALVDYHLYLTATLSK